MNIYQIELPEQIYPRRDITMKNDCGIKIIKVPFVRKCAKEITIDNTYHRKRFGFDFSKNEIHDFCTHRNAWKMFLESGKKYALIVETNVKLEVTSQQLSETLSSFPDELDLYFPYDTFQYMNLHPGSGGTLLNPNFRELRRNEPYELRCKWGNSIYFISRKGAGILLKIDCFQNRLDNLIVSMSLSEELTVCYDTENWFDYKNIEWREWPDRINNIWDAILNSSTWNEVRKQKVRDLLKILSITCADLNIKPLLQGGSHLGYVQHNGIMPWDDDVDIGIEESQLSMLLQSLSKHKNLRFKDFIEPGTHAPYYKIWDINGEQIENYEYTFPFIDLWLYEVKSPDLKFLNGIVCPNAAVK